MVEKHEKYFASTSGSINFIEQTFYKMSNANSTNQTRQATRLQSKQQWRMIGIIMTVVGILLGLGIESSNSDLGAMLLLIGLIGIGIWIVNGIAVRKIKKIENL